ncbi:MAG TPA: TonB-dependent receptor plug domain-containing protein, partial [Thermoanaerobaculia bacterium]|nr:TonB-dependent receptor plug domain-containing protein [Thermoanaerobaculia bacterium]
MNLLLFLFLALPPQKISDRIVVTASDVPETIESTPAAVTVVTRKDIDERAARDVADVLREVPGLTISRTGSPGKATSLFTRGANSTHTLVLWNGIEINNPYFSGYDWGRFSTAGVEQVEVVRGPFSALYGSDAVAGVVNVLTV